MTDGSSRPHDSPSRCSRRLERRIVKLRYLRRWGPHRISYYLGAPRSTVGRVLARYRMPLLAHVDQATGLPVRKSKPVRYEASAPGELVHVDIKKLGKIPDGGGWRVFGRGSEQHRRSGVATDRAARAGAPASRGYVYLHHAVDDHTRLVYSEQLDDERRGVWEPIIAVECPQRPDKLARRYWGEMYLAIHQHEGPPRFIGLGREAAHIQR
jgi:hypothetical protein